MKLNYYADMDSLSIDLSERPSVESREITEGVVLDYDAPTTLPEAFPPGPPGGAPLPHPAAPVQHQPTPCSAVLRLAPGRSGGGRWGKGYALRRRSRASAAGGTA